MTTEQSNPVAPATRTLCTWARQAPAGAWCQYHVGALSIDRAASRDLHELAETVALLADYGYVNASQMRVPHDPDGATAYLATRTGQGYPPPCVLDCTISAVDFQALRVIKSRDEYLSATRALRYGLGVGEATAIAIFDRLKQLGMVEKASSGGGWDVASTWRARVF